MPIEGSSGNSNYALDRLRDLLRSGSVDADGRLPTERELSTSFGVSRRDLRRALEVLEMEGRIWRRQGSGTYAGRRPDPSRRGIRRNLVADELRSPVRPLGYVAPSRRYDEVSPGHLVRLDDGM